jgi:hypothetical protein
LIFRINGDYFPKQQLVFLMMIHYIFHEEGNEL